MKFSKLLILSPVLLVLGACSDDTDYNFENSLQQAQAPLQQAAAAGPAEAKFDVAAGELPSPINLAFAGTEDGTLNITIPEDASASDPRRALNTLDGFSTIEPVVTQFSIPIDGATAVIGDTVRVFELVSDNQGLPQGIATELTTSDLATEVAGETTLAIIPRRPLKESTNYMFVVTSGVRNLNGANSTPSLQFGLVSSAATLENNDVFRPLEAVRLATYPLIQLADSQGITSDDIVVAWSVKTQSLTHSLQSIAEQDNASTLAVANTGSTTTVITGSPGFADIYAGTLELPYYRTAPSSVNDPVGASSFWTGAEASFLTQLNPSPITTSTQAVPVLMSVPNTNSGSAMPASGWPITIFMHGITADRTNMLAIADAMARAGRAVIAIDQPMHGLTDPTSPFYVPGAERTFDLDLVNNTTGARVPDGITDPSGRHYYSPLTLLASRDNLRQAAADLMVLSESLAGIQGVPVDSSNITLVGHSLGGTVGTTFLAFAKPGLIRAATLGMPAAGLARMLLDSEAFGPPLQAGLSAAGIEPGTPELQSFLVAAQAVIDSGDSINFAAQAISKTPVHMIEVIGETTVPNNVAGAPLAGTDALARLMGFDPNSPVSANTSGPGLVQFTQGIHGTLLTPVADPENPQNPPVFAASFTEMQNQTVVFAASGGTNIQISNPSVIKGAN